MPVDTAPPPAQDPAAQHPPAQHPAAQDPPAAGAPAQAPAGEQQPASPIAPRRDAPDQGTGAAAGTVDPGPDKVRRPSVTAVVIAVVVAVAGVLLVLYAWRLPPFATSVMTTNDAYVQGRVTGMATQVSGYVRDVLVEDYQTVRRGQPLARLDPRTYQQQVDQARGTLDASIANLDNAAQTINTNRANLQSAQADLIAKQAEGERTATDLRRLSDLAARGSISIRDRDQAVSDARTAAANVAKSRASIRVAAESIKTAIVQRQSLAATVESNRAALEQARINLADTVIYAPHDGQVGATAVNQGQYVAAGSQLIYFVPRTIWVVANFKETQTRNMRVGQTASVAVDALGGVRVAGRVVALSPATGSQFSVLKPDNASGNFTKVVQRLPVKIALDMHDRFAARMRPGLSVVAHVETAAATAR